MIYAFPQFPSFIAFVIERYRIYERRAAGKPQPWTKDPILKQYKFCNVYRELDRVTMWLAEHWREPQRNYPDLWFAMVVARLINHPDSLEEMLLPGRWNKKNFLSVMHTRHDAGEKIFSSAYIVSTGGKSMNKAEYLAQYVLDPLWMKREFLRPVPGMTLSQYHTDLMKFNGMGSFIAAQVIADLKYAPPFEHAKDWWTFASSGPGSRRGMWRVMGKNPRDDRWKEHEWREALSELRALMRPHLEEERMPKMHAQDAQNCLCEWEKYRRTELGEGKPKQLFQPYDGEL